MADAEREPEILNRPVPLGGDTEEITFRIKRRLPGRRLDKYLHGRFPRLSRTLIQRLIKQGEITVNGKSTKASYELATDDLVRLIIPPPEPLDVQPDDIPLDIVYEDDFMLALNKQTGVICHPARSSQTGTLANGLVHYSNHLSHGDDPFRPGIVHRLDKNTTGIMLVAKNDEAHWRLSLQFEQRTITKIYMAVVEGTPSLDGDVIDAPIGSHPMVKDRYMVPGMRHRPELLKKAVTRYEIVERYRRHALVRMFPKTGRTHQLRVHMSYIGHPIVGDTFYGGHHLSEHDITGEGDESSLFVHQALHARRITFRHPIKETEMTLEAPFPPSFERLLALLRTRQKT
jgi:23S rRNA pseudouridine1911/1915/1917 synthase